LIPEHLPNLQQVMTETEDDLQEIRKHLVEIELNFFGGQLRSLKAQCQNQMNQEQLALLDRRVRRIECAIQKLRDLL